MHSKKYLALFLIICMMSSDVMIPLVLAGNHGGRGGHGLELLLAAGILAKLLRKKGHHHGHHHHGHHHHHGGRHSSGGIHPHEAGAQTVEVVHVAPPLGGYSSHYPTSAQSSYGGAQAATSFSSSIEYPFNAASQPMPIHHLPYGGPASAASYLGYEPQPVQMYPPLPLSITDSPGAPVQM